MSKVSKTGYVMIVEQDISDKRAFFCQAKLVKNRTLLTKQWSLDFLLISPQRVQSQFACFLLAINFGIFVESNGQKLRHVQIKQINECWVTRPARTYFCGTSIPCSTIIT